MPIARSSFSCVPLAAPNASSRLTGMPATTSINPDGYANGVSRRSFLTATPVAAGLVLLGGCNPVGIKRATVVSNDKNKNSVGRKQNITVTFEIGSTDSVNIELRHVNVDRLAEVIKQPGFVMERKNLDKLGRLEFVRDLMEGLSSKRIHTSYELGQEIIRAMRSRMSYNKELGTTRHQRSEYWYIKEQQAICDSYARVFCALYEYTVQQRFRKFASTHAHYIAGLRSASYTDEGLSEHAFNGLLEFKNGTLTATILDPTFGAQNYTRERMPDLIYFLYSKQIIDKKEAIRVFDAMIRADGSVYERSRKWALANRMVINNESAKSGLESIKSISNYLQGMKHLSHAEVRHVLFMPVEDYVLMGNRRWDGYLGCSLNEFARGVSKRADEIIRTLRSNDNPHVRAYVQLRLRKIKTIADGIRKNISQNAIRSVYDVSDDLSELYALFTFTRKNQAVIQHLLKTNRVK